MGIIYRWIFCYNLKHILKSYYPLIKTYFYLGGRQKSATPEIKTKTKTLNTCSFICISNFKLYQRLNEVYFSLRIQRSLSCLVSGCCHWGHYSDSVRKRGKGGRSRWGPNTIVGERCFLFNGRCWNFFIFSMGWWRLAGVLRVYRFFGTI